MSSHPIPIAALDDRLGFVGTSGSGKTYNAGSAVERLLARKARVVIVDPLGVWWGLRLDAGGKERGFDVAIFGGPHGDLPLNDHAGALIGETAATMAESCIVDLSQLGTKAAERRFMTGFLETIYRKAGGEPLHLIVDEADLFAPQKPSSGDETLLGLMEQIVRRGRVKGFVPWLITQRPAVINKNVLSQVDGLIAFKLTSSQDRDALDAWIEGQADKAQGKAIKDALPTLPIGTGVVWLPSRSVLETKAFPRKATFDSSRAPKRGEKVKRTALKPLDLGALQERLASVVAETKASDPKALRAEITDLRRQLAAKAVAVPVDPDAIAKAEQRGFEQARKKLGAELEKELKVRIAAMVTALRGAGDAFASEVKTVVAAAGGGADLKGAIAFEAAPAARVLRPVPSVVPRPPLRAKPATPIDGDRPLGAERKPLAVLASVHPAGMTEAQWAVAAGLKRTGGTWSTYVSRLRTAGRAQLDSAGLWFITEDALAELGEDIEPMPQPGRELVDFWAQRITGASPMLKRLAEVYPNWIEREQLAADLNLAAGGGTFNTYLSRLRSPGLIEEGADKTVRASPMLMEGRAAA